MRIDELAAGSGPTAANAVRALTELGRIVLADTSIEDALGAVARLARSAIGPADEASVTLVIHDRPTSAAFTGPLASELDERQYEVGFGPCLDAARGGETLMITDITAEPRWPRYAPLAGRTGMRSSLSLPLPVQEHLVGALNLYSLRPGAFGVDEARLGALFASYAAVAVANAHAYSDAGRLAEGMRAAMASRAVIEQAKGIVMAQRRCTADAAFGYLTELSQHGNRKLRDVAAGLVAATQKH